MSTAAAVCPRDVDRVERIRAPTEARLRLVLHTAPLCRTVRKDYNIVSAKMFLSRAQKTLKLSTALRDLERAAVESELSAERYRRKYEGVTLEARSFEIRVVSPFCNRYQRCITRLDATNYLLVQAETVGVITRKERMEIVRPCLDLLHEIKRIALDLPERQGSSDTADFAMAS